MMENPTETSRPEGKLAAVASAASSAAQKLSAVKEMGAERYVAARDKLMDQWAETKDDLGQLRQKAVDYSQSAARATNTFAHDHPWTTAGAAIGVGALIGWLVAHRADQARSNRR